jgi:hypothetical protein
MGMAAVEGGNLTKQLVGAGEEVNGTASDMVSLTEPYTRFSHASLCRGVANLGSCKGYSLSGPAVVS